MGDEFVISGYRFKIQAMRRRRISTIRVTRLPEPSGEDASDGAADGAAGDGGSSE